jgi:hypothetical protein
MFVPIVRNYPRETVEAILDVRKSVLPVIGISLRYVCTCHARIPICARAIHLTTSNVLQYYARFPRSAKYAYIEMLPLQDQTTAPLQLAVSDSIHCAASTDSLVIFSSHCRSGISRPSRSLDETS